MKALTLLAALFAVAASADPTCSLTSSATTIDSPGSITLSFASTGAASCTASSSGNQAAWTGSKALSGKQTLTGIKASADYVFACTAAQTVGSAQLNWTPPTANTDGTPLKDLAGYDVLYGATCSTLGQTLTLNNSSLTGYVVPLAPGSYCFAVEAFNVAGTRSDPSNTAQKTVAGDTPATCSASVHIDVLHTPEKPTGVRVVP